MMAIDTQEDLTVELNIVYNRSTGPPIGLHFPFIVVCHNLSSMILLLGEQMCTVYLKSNYKKEYII